MNSKLKGNNMKLKTTIFLLLAACGAVYAMDNEEKGWGWWSENTEPEFFEPDREEEGLTDETDKKIAAEAQEPEEQEEMPEWVRKAESDLLQYLERQEKEKKEREGKTAEQLKQEEEAIIQRQKEEQAAREKQYGKYARYKYGRPITFLDYYNGNAEVGIEPIAKEYMNMAARSGILQLTQLGLTDLEGIENLPNFKNLHTIIAADNLLTEIPQSIGECHNLQQLNLATNQIVEIPDFIWSLVNLDNLILINNRITTISDSVSKLKQLKDLRLNGNSIVSLPKSISQLPNLRWLSLFNNPIPVGHEQLIAELGLRPSVVLAFKSNKQERAEYELIEAIRTGDEETFRKRLKQLLTERLVPAFFARGLRDYEKVDISKIRDANGNNLLHVLVNALVNKRKEIEKDPELSEQDKKEELRLANERYTRMFLLFFELGIPQARRMLFERNAKGNDVLLSAIGNIGPLSPFVKTMIDLAYAIEPRVPARETRMIPRPSPVQQKEEKEGKEIASAPFYPTFNN